MFVDLFAHAADGAFGDDPAVGDEDDLVGEDIDLLQDVA
jgi:hypothetical protein